jgi:hypothetical protein
MQMCIKTMFVVMGFLWGFVKTYPDNQSVLRYLEEYGEAGPEQIAPEPPIAFVLDTTMTQTVAGSHGVSQRIALPKQ